MSAWQRVRSLFPVTDAGVYLDHAGAAPVSSRVDEAVRGFLDAAMRRGGLEYDARVAREVERVRVRVASLLAAEPGEIAFVSRAERGLERVAGDVDWRRGDALALASDGEPPVWRRLAERGVEILRVPLEGRAPRLERLEAALRHPRVRLLALAGVDASCGARAPLEAIGRLCRERGVLLCVEGSQQLGCLPLDVGACGVDYLAADAQRFLLGLAGTGILYRSRRSARDAGSAALTFEAGPANAVGIVALGAAVDLLLELGIERIEARVLGLVARLVRGLEERGVDAVCPDDAERSAIVCFRLDREPAARTAERLLARRICVATTPQGVRVSPHAYNDEADIDALLAAL